MIFTKDPVKPFEAFTKKDIFYTDKKLDIRFEDKLTHQDTILLLQYNCPEPNCDVACSGWGELKKHTNKEHHLVLCDLCIKNKKIFAHEHTLYTPAQLNKHYKSGDKEAFNKDDDSGFKGHPECHFCRQSFYGDDELYVHCRDKHEQCHICVRNGSRHQYYPDYNGLEKHFRKDHYLCQYRECLDKKFIVFDSDLDLAAHEVEVHGASGRVDLSFDYGAKSGNASGSGRGGNRNKQKVQQQQQQQQQQQHHHQEASSASGVTATSSPGLSSSDFPSINGRSAPPSAEHTIPGQPKKNRQNEKQNARLQKPKGFGGLSSNNDEQWPGLGQVSSNSSTGSPSTSTNTNDSKKKDVDAPTDIQQRHAEVLQRITRLLNGNNGVQQFRALTTAYRNNSLDANGYVGEIINLCNNDSTKAGTILKDVEDLMDSEEKKRDILRAWRNAQANLQNFPALASLDDRSVAGPGTSQRVLVIKGGSTRVGGTRTTSKSKAGVWDRVANAAAHGTATPHQSSSSSPRGSPVSSRPGSPMTFPTPHMNRTKTAWAGTSGTSSSNVKQKEDFPAITQQFPSLPGASRRPHPTVLTMRRNNNNASAWSSSSPATSDNDYFDSTDDNNLDTATSTTIDKKKKGKKGKQVLFRVGL
ncbi:unnamed protein product [Absidia cylindrospora]